MGAPYGGVDAWTMTTLPQGSIVYGGLPGQSAFYTNASAVVDSGVNASNLFGTLQVAPDAAVGFRPAMGIYEVTSDIDVPTSLTMANPQFGPGGATQFYITDWGKLQLEGTVPLGH